MYLSSTNPKTKFTKDAAIQTIILAGSYFGAMLLAGNKIKRYAVSPVNPAVAFGIWISNVSGDNTANLWVFLGGPIAGSVIALTFFRFIYEKTAILQQQIEEEEEDERNEEALGENLLDNKKNTQ